MLKLRRTIAGAALLCMAFDSSALTLGRLHGAPLIGQALEVSVQVQLGAGEDAASRCFEAEVAYADSPQDASQIRVVVEPAAQTDRAEVRISSSAVVNEPVVTLNLRYGCGQKSSRRYVLLADLPDQSGASSNPAVLAPAVAPAVGVKAEAPFAAASGNPPPMASAASAKTAKASVKGKAFVRPKPFAGRQTQGRRHARHSAAHAKPVASARNPKPVQSVAQPRLKLDPLDLLSDRIANLDSSMTFAPPEDALLKAQKVQALEGEVKALRDAAAKNERSLADIQAHLQQAQSERSSGAIVYVLAALLLASSLTVVWLWTRQRHGSLVDRRWWNDAAVQEAPAAAALVDVPAPGEASARADLEQPQAPGERRVAATAAGRPAGLEAHAIELTESAFSDFMRAGAPDREARSGSALPAKLVRNLNSGAILEMRRQAEKFVAQGKPEQAVAVLRNQISASDEPNPMVYLDLLGLCHALNRKKDYQQFAQDFNLLFNGRIPEFAFFKNEGNALEAYPEVLSHIVGCWPKSQVLELIEACIFRDPWASGSEPFDLAAMRDLLLLHGIAQSLVMAAIASEDADAVATSFPGLQPSVKTGSSGQTRESHPALDLDLSNLGMEASSEKDQPVADIDLDLLLPGGARARDQAALDIELPRVPGMAGAPDRSSAG